MSAIARIASAGSLSAGKLVSSHGPQKSLLKSAKKSLDRQLNRSASRSSSDLTTLDGGHGETTMPSRPVSPSPMLFALQEQPSFPEDDLIHMDALSLGLDVHTAWASMAVASDQSVAEECAAEFSVPDLTCSLKLAEEPSLKVIEQPVDPVVLETPQNVLRVYKGTMQLQFVQDMLDNLKHIMTMASQATKDSQATGAAASAAKFLSRSLGRAATRVRNLALNKSDLLLTLESMVTLKEFGYVEMTTLDEGASNELKMVEMDEHDLATGIMTHYSRISPADPWFAIGTAPTSVRSIRQALGGAVPPALASLVQDAPAPTSGFSLMGLAQSLQDAAVAVQAAAENLQRWVEEAAAAMQPPAQPATAAVCAA